MKKPIATILSASCLLVGCAATYHCNPGQETTPVSRFEISRADGTAFDTKTKLTWKICAEGQSYSDGHCTGEAKSFTWNNAVQAFGDKGDNWRLPNVDELRGIAEGQCQYPAVNMKIFPGTPSGGFWSASPQITKSTEAWNVSFSSGGLIYI